MENLEEKVKMIDKKSKKLAFFCKKINKKSKLCENSEDFIKINKKVGKKLSKLVKWMIKNEFLDKKGSNSVAFLKNKIKKLKKSDVEGIYAQNVILFLLILSKTSEKIALKEDFFYFHLN